MKQYPKYKDSKISWIGDVPEHWALHPFGKYFRYGKGLNITKADLLPSGVKVISYGQIHSKSNGGTKITDDLVRYVSQDYLASSPQSLVLQNDFIFADTSEDLEGCGNCAFVHEPMTLFAGYHTVICRPNHFDNYKFLAYYFQSVSWRSQLRSNCNGVKVYSISRGKLKKTQIIVPPADEQQAIVEFLDTAVEKIDRYIAAKEAEIEKLGTLKQSIISQAVTKGLDPNAPMKDSGIPWIGNIPEHWEKMRTKNMFIRMNRPVESDDEVITCFRDGQVTLRKNRRTEGFTESFKEIGYQGIRPGDLVVHQMDAFAGAIGVSDSKGKGTPVYICLQPKGDYSNYYYAYLLREMARKGYIKSLYRGIRERSSDFRYETLGKLFLPIPPLAEQQAIVKYINEQVQKIDTSIGNIRQQIEKLKTYKQRLISDAVTGKIDVRERLG